MKDLKISTELISSVLVKETRHLTYDTIYVEDNFIIFSYEGECKFELNISEFVFKCKEWVMGKYGITISSALYKNYAKSWNIDKDKSYTAKTEVEVIIEACSGILEQNK